MKVLVCGSRDWTDGSAILNRLSDLPGECERIIVIHGDAPGADRLARDSALYWGLEVRPFPADWAKHGKAAGPIRNRQMLDEEPDLVIAFQRNGSRGTQDTIDKARRRGIPVEVHTP